MHRSRISCHPMFGTTQRLRTRGCRQSACKCQVSQKDGHDDRLPTAECADSTKVSGSAGAERGTRLGVSQGRRFRSLPYGLHGHISRPKLLERRSAALHARTRDRWLGRRGWSRSEELQERRLSRSTRRGLAAAAVTCAGPGKKTTASTKRQFALPASVTMEDTFPKERRQ